MIADQGSMMEGENIICFAKDWGEDPTSCNHVLQGLAAKNRVIWLNSISTRSPKLGSSRDTGKIFKKIAAFFRGPVMMQDNLWQFTPLVVPFHGRPIAVAINKFLLKLTFAMLRLRLGISKFQLWTFVPTSALYVDSLGASLMVYYCTDNWSGFSTVDGPAMASMMENLARKADVVFATSHMLVDKLAEFNPNTHLAAHGVDYELFSTAVKPETELPGDIAEIRRPILGYYGLVEDWLDFELLERLARNHPDWSLVFIGKKMADTSRIDSLPNVHFLGRKPHDELPRYCKAFSVGLIPHQINSLTRHMNPIKLREYLCAGVPIVSTDLPEVAYYANYCSAARSYDEFEAAVATAIATDTQALREQRSASMQTESWDQKLANLTRIVQATVSSKSGGRHEKLGSGSPAAATDQVL